MPYIHPITKERMLTDAEVVQRHLRRVAMEPLDPVMAAMLDRLPLLARAALMSLRESQARRAVVARLMLEAGGRVPLTFGDFAPLRDQGLATWNRGKRLHDATPLGIEAAGQLEKLLCQQYGLHIMSESGGSRYTAGFVCSCGGWSTQSHKGDFTAANATHAHARHVDQANGEQRFRHVAEALLAERG